MKGIVDRFEGNYAVIEIDGETKDIPRTQVSDHVQAGDVVIFKEGKWERDQEATVKRTNEIKKLMESVWED